MIGVDTNILVRFITKDDASQTSLVFKLFEQQKGKAKSIYVNVITLCELIWVLDSGYDYAKNQIVSALYGRRNDYADCGFSRSIC